MQIPVGGFYIVTVVIAIAIKKFITITNSLDQLINFYDTHKYTTYANVLIHYNIFHHSFEIYSSD